MANQMDGDQARRVLKEARRRAALVSKLDLEKLAFDQQRAFLTDPSKLKAALCSRRAGKSHGVALAATKSCLKHRNAIVPFIAPSKGQAKTIIWQALKDIDHVLELGMKFNSHDLTVSFPQTGSYIKLCGADDREDVEKLLGGKYPDVFIDECQSFRPYLKDLIEHVLDPAVSDYNGTIWLTGTPGAACTGFFHDVTTGLVPGWSVHRWTILDNPYHPAKAEFLQKKRERNGWSEDHPTYMREWRGIWVNDSKGLVYRMKGGITVVQSLPDNVDDWQFVLGLDLGYVDSTAFVVLAYSITAGQVYVVHSYKEKGLIPSAVAARVERLMKRYDITKIVADTGGLGKGYAEEMRQRYGLPVEAAKKREKLAFIELMNGDLASGVLHIVQDENQDLLEEMTLLQWDEDRKAPDERFQDHLCDALLYGWRFCRQYLHEDEQLPPKYGSPEYYELQAKLDEQALIARIEREESGDHHYWDEPLGAL